MQKNSRNILGNSYESHWFHSNPSSVEHKTAYQKLAARPRIANCLARVGHSPRKVYSTLPHLKRSSISEDEDAKRRMKHEANSIKPTCSLSSI